MSTHRVYVNGKVHVRKRPCATCIFGAHSPVSDERVADMVATCGDDGVIPCHHHLGDAIEPVCSGYYQLRANATLRIAAALDAIEWVEGDPWKD